MPPADVDDSYFNDLSRQPNPRTSSSTSLPNQDAASGQYDQCELPKTKRIACVLCRKRKLKCDGAKPKCATCARLGHVCAYDEIRRKSGPKRGYVKELEARLAQVESQLKEPKKAKSNATESAPSTAEQRGVQEARSDTAGKTNWQNEVSLSMPQSSSYETMPATSSSYNGPIPNMVPEAASMPMPDFAPDMNFVLDDNFSWELIGLGLEEPMPTQEAVDELTSIYFDKVHPALPMVHKYRFYASMKLLPQSRPPICLRYIMWCLAAAITDKYIQHQDIFYRRARKYVELDEMKGSGEAFASLAHCQTWTLLATYEFKMMYFPRAWMSTGRACRLAVMLGLHKVDGLSTDYKRTMPPPTDWRETEERRRTFWSAYCVDRYASMGTSWPMTLEERDIVTKLPATEEAYENCTPEETVLLQDSLTHAQVASLSSFGAVVYVTHFFGLNIHHIHRPEADDADDNLQGKFWRRHRNLDNILLNISLSLPSHLRLPSGVRNPNVVFLNFAIHAATICLHQSAIFRAEMNQLPAGFIDQSRTRCMLGASEIANAMRLTCHLDIHGMNPFMAFCLYIAAKVFVQHLKNDPGDQESRNALDFLLTAMSAVKKKNPLTESFIVQLKLDIEGTGLDALLRNPDLSTMVKDRLRSGVMGTVGTAKDGYSCGSQITVGENDFDTRSPEDLRSTERSSSNNPSIHSDSPPQNQFASRNAEVSARNGGQMRPENNRTDSQPHNIPPWWSPHLTEKSPVSLDSLSNNNVNPPGFDTEMVDNLAQTSRHSSNVLTPQSSTTYVSSSASPPQGQEEDTKSPSVPTTGTSMPPGSNVYRQPKYFPPFSDRVFPTVPSSSHISTANGNFPAPPPPDLNSIDMEQNDAFKCPPGWEMGSGFTPGFSGMVSEGDWEKMMQGIGWDEGAGMSPK